MDSFYAPYVHDEEELVTAIAQIAAIKSPALIVAKAEHHFLFTSETVFETYARSTDITRCWELNNESGYKIGDLNGYNLPVPPPSVGSSQLGFTYLFEQLMQQENLDYGFLLPTQEANAPRLALVVTQRETLKSSIVGTNTICVCTGPNRHLSYNSNCDGKTCDSCEHKYYGTNCTD